MSGEERDGMDAAIDRVARRMVTAPHEPDLVARLAAALPARTAATGWREWTWPALALGGAAALVVATLVYPIARRDAVDPTPATSPGVAMGPAASDAAGIVAPAAGSYRAGGRGAAEARRATAIAAPVDAAVDAVQPSGVRSPWPLGGPSPLEVSVLSSDALDLGVVRVAPVVVDALPAVAALPSEWKE